MIQAQRIEDLQAQTLNEYFTYRPCLMSGLKLLSPTGIAVPPKAQHGCAGGNSVVKAWAHSRASCGFNFKQRHLFPCLWCETTSNVDAPVL